MRVCAGVVLPGETMKFPFVFKSPNPGVFQEQWEFQTRPLLCGGAALIVTLRGVSLQEDKFKQQRSQLEVRTRTSTRPRALQEDKFKQQRSQLEVRTSTSTRPCALQVRIFA